MFDSPDPDLRGLHALVTGAGRGIGAAFALALARHGAHVHVLARTATTVEDTARRIREAGGTADTHVADVSDRGAVDAVARSLSSLDLLVNNAGVLGPVATLADYDPAAFSQVLRVNVEGVFHVTQAVLPLLLRSSRASVVNLSSGVGRQGRATWGAYAASKFAVEGLTQVWADEHRGRVRFNALNPGGTRTAMRAAAKPNEDPNTLPTPEDVVPSLFHLVKSEDTGTSIDARDFMARTGVDRARHGR